MKSKGKKIKKKILKIKRLSVTTYLINIDDVKPYFADHYAYPTRQKKIKEYIESLKKPSSKSIIKTRTITKHININQQVCSFLSENYSEFVTSNPLDDLKEYHRWQNHKKSYPYHSAYLPLEILLEKPFKPNASVTAIENIGCISLGLIIHKSKIKQKPIARPTNRSPDLISFYPSSNIFCFNEAKAIYKADDFKKNELITVGINDLITETCGLYRLILTKVVKLYPAEVEVEIINLRPNTKIKTKYGVILDTLSPSIQSEIIFGEKKLSDVINEIFGEQIAKTILEDSKNKIKEINEEIKSKKNKNLNKINEIKKILKDERNVHAKTILKTDESDIISEEELIQELDSIEEIDIGDQEDDPIEIY